MRCSEAILGLLLLAPISSRGEDRPLDWVKVTDRAGWQARDSSGEVVYKDRLWLLGGWFDSFSAPPRDVWSSPDGATWTLAAKEAPWTASDLPMSIIFDGRMWLMGGLVQRQAPGPRRERRGLVFDRRRELDNGDEEGRLESAHRRRRGGLQGADVDPRRHGELLLRR